jgi:hypothetical protein
MGGEFVFRFSSNLKNLPEKRCKFHIQMEHQNIFNQYIFQRRWRDYFLSYSSHSFNIEKSAPSVEEAKTIYTGALEYFESVQKKTEVVQSNGFDMP